MTIAALFDMDKTVLRVDSAMSWTRFQRARGEMSRAVLLKAIYWSSLYKLALLDMDDVFGRLVADLRGDSEAMMVTACDEWFRAELQPAIAPAARVAIAHHRALGHEIVLATGSTQYAAAPVARALGIEHVLSSVLEVADGVFTGASASRCFGAHKVTMAEAWAARHGIELGASTFYSDSYNDLPMLSRVGRAVAVNPDARLRRHARRHAWPILDWH
jgi:HAD superfamily hydrolase (TIGR01490 family)